MLGTVLNEAGAGKCLWFDLTCLVLNYKVNFFCHACTRFTAGCGVFQPLGGWLTLSTWEGLAGMLRADLATALTGFFFPPFFQGCRFVHGFLWACWRHFPCIRATAWLTPLSVSVLHVLVLHVPFDRRPDLEITKTNSHLKTQVIIACFCLLCVFFSRAGLRAHSRSSSRRHGNRCQAWPSMAPVSLSLLTLLWVLCWLMDRVSPVPVGGLCHSPSTHFWPVPIILRLGLKRIEWVHMFVYSCAVTVLFLRSIRGRHGGQCDVAQQDAAQGCHMTSQTLNSGAANSRAQQSGVKRSKVRHAESRDGWGITSGLI